MWNVHMPNRCGSAQYGVRWSTYRNMTWHALSNGERWRRNSCWCCRKQSGRDWIKVSGKGPLDGLLFSPIQLDVSLSCQEGITAGWFINTWSDLAATRLCVCMCVYVFVLTLVSVCGSHGQKKRRDTKWNIFKIVGTHRQRLGLTWTKLSLLLDTVSGLFCQHDKGIFLNIRALKVPPPANVWEK